ncbi:MAG: tRNA (N(6)-L-threonylcarbamoyladenosine(37)-C(2))-methylthiotransferase MtaB [Anaerohalosphaeraceae bacterium]
MKHFIIHTLGCKVNQYESCQIEQWLRSHGVCPAPSGSPADLVIVNTCCITQTAASKSRQAVRKLHKQNPSALLILTGCLSAATAEETADLPKTAVWAADKHQLLDILRSLSDSSEDRVSNGISKTPFSYKIKHKNDLDIQQFPDCDPFGPLNSFSGQTRAFLKIQDGCDVFCTYCIVPKIRKKLWSKPTDVILREAEDLLAAGHKEIVLTGIFLGAWGRSTARRKHWKPDEPNPLVSLLKQILKLPNLIRLRLSSLEPADVTDELIEVYQQYPNLVPHLHLPLQSGSDRILKRMARQYTSEEYLNICRKLQERLDRPAITTDIIVGFPGETEEDFEKTVEVCRQVGFAKMHIFPFSPRRGTAAARMKPPVPAGVIRRRAEKLQKLDKELQEKFRRQFIGQTVRVILEQTNPPAGRCDRYFMVDCSTAEFPEPPLQGQVVSIRLDR